MPNVDVVLLKTERNEGKQGLTMGAVSGGKLVGHITIERRETIWYIVDIYVEKEERRKGIATTMLQSIINTIDRGGSFINIEAVYMDDDRMSEIDSFFDAQGNFEIATESALVTVTKNGREKSPAYVKLTQKEKVNAIPYFSVDSLLRNEYMKYLISSHNDVFLEDLDSGRYDEELCMASVQSGKIQATLFVKKHSDTEYEIAFYNVRDFKPAGTDVLKAAAIAFEEKHASATLWYNEAEEDISKLTEVIFGDNAKKSNVKIAKWTGFPVNASEGE